MSVETIRIRVVNWEKHNQGRNGKRWPWFKFSTSFPYDEKMHGLSTTQRYAFVCLLCLCSDKGSDTFTIARANLARTLNIPGANLDQTLTKLRLNLLIEVGDNIDEKNSRFTRQDKTRQDNTTSIVDNNSCELKPAIEEWRTTLESFGIKKDPAFDEVAILRLIHRHGEVATLAALRGARLEAKTENYDPAKHCSISRVSRPEVFDKFVNLGSQVFENQFPREEPDATN